MDDLEGCERPSTQNIADYPDLERTDYDVALDQVRSARPIRPMPLVVLSADVRYGPTLPAALDKGEIPPDTPQDFGYVIDRANKVAQEKLANLVPGAKHITKTDSGHNMMIEQPLLVTDAIREVVDAVRHGGRSLSGWLKPLRREVVPGASGRPSLSPGCSGAVWG